MGLFLRCGATGCAGRGQPFLPSTPQLTRSGVQATVGGRRDSARVVSVTGPHPGLRLSRAVMQKRRGLHEQHDRLLRAEAFQGGVAMARPHLLDTKVRLATKRYAATGSAPPGQAVGILLTGRALSRSHSRARRCVCRASCLWHSASSASSPSLIRTLLSMTMEEHWSSWRETLGSVPKMCIMLSARHQARLEAEAKRKLEAVACMPGVRQTPQQYHGHPLHNWTSASVATTSR